MHVCLEKFIAPEQTIAVAVSGGSDSVALLHYMLSQSKKYSFRVIALNVEHGIRGSASIDDSIFVKNLCEKWGVELVSYAVNCPDYAKKEKLTLEESARKLRYECFYDAINNGKCDKVATAHHMRDNAESVLFNLFRGTSLSGVSGITPEYDNKIIRPFLTISKQEIDEYIAQNNLEYVTDQTNFDNDYARNYIRQNVLPEIRKVFPEFEKSIWRFSTIAREQNEYLDKLARERLIIDGDAVKIALPVDNVILSKASIFALKELGVKKDWTKAHIDAIEQLQSSLPGTKIDLLDGVVAIKEYSEIVLYRQKELCEKALPFALGKLELNGYKLEIKKVAYPNNLKDAFYADLSKIPNGAVIRFRRDGDLFTKFGGGTKPLAEYLTDVKIPLRMRNFIPVIADGNDVLAIIGVAISQKIKVDENTTQVIEILGVTIKER